MIQTTTTTPHFLTKSCHRSLIFLSLIMLQITSIQSFFLPTTTTTTNLVAFTKTSSSSSSSSARPMSKSNNDDEETEKTAVDMSDVGFILLAGGTGSRMKATIPKQFLDLKGSPILHHSLHLFLERLPKFAEENGVGKPAMIILVIDPIYQPEYQPIIDKYPTKLAFANPGKERQFSVQNGLHKLQSSAPSCTYVAVHDSARPLVTISEIMSVLSDAKTYGAAVLGVKCKATIKESDNDDDGGSLVLRTIPRERLWEVHTPQVVRVEALVRGFEKVEREDLEVTDDVSIVEALGEDVKLTRGEYTNLKITTPEDMDVASAILEERGLDRIDLLG